MTYNNENVNDHGGRLDVAKKQCVDAMMSCTPGISCCHGITCTGGDTEFQFCLAKKGPALTKGMNGENSYVMDCTEYFQSAEYQKRHSPDDGNPEHAEGYHCPVSEWDTWGKCCGSPGWRQRQRSVVDIS